MRVMISCGEPSGDLYAGALAAEILALDPSASITGFGGDRLAAAGARLVENFSGLSVTGLLEVVRLLPRTYATYRRLLAAADAARPDVFVAIDFPDFNFALARAMKKRGVPVVYYISPQLWAWRSGRMKTMQRVVDRVLVIFPFEEEIYRNAGVPVQWVGHPLFDVQPPHQPRETFLPHTSQRCVVLVAHKRAPGAEGKFEKKLTARREKKPERATFRIAIRVHRSGSRYAPSTAACSRRPTSHRTASPRSSPLWRVSPPREGR